MKKIRLFVTYEISNKKKKGFFKTYTKRFRGRENKYEY